MSLDNELLRGLVIKDQPDAGEDPLRFYEERYKRNVALYNTLTQQSVTTSAGIERLEIFAGRYYLKRQMTSDREMLHQLDPERAAVITSRLSIPITRKPLQLSANNYREMTISFKE